MTCRTPDVLTDLRIAASRRHLLLLPLALTWLANGAQRSSWQTPTLFDRGWTVVLALVACGSVVAWLRDRRAVSSGLPRPVKVAGGWEPWAMLVLTLGAAAPVLGGGGSWAAAGCVLVLAEIALAVDQQRVSWRLADATEASAGSARGSSPVRPHQG